MTVCWLRPSGNIKRVQKTRLAWKLPIVDYLVTEPGIRIIGGLAFLFILYSVWMGQMTAQGLPDDYPNPVLALELVKNGPDIKKVFDARPVKAEDGSVRDFLRRNTYKDFGFIFVYALFFIALSLLLSRTNLSWAKWAGYLAAGCAALGAIMDLIEDRGMLKAIAGEASDSLANSIRYPSLAKWGLLFLFSLIVGLVLSARRDLFLFPGVFFLLAALLGLAGVVLNLLRPKFYSTFPGALASMGAGIVVLAVAFIFCPDKFLDKISR